ncbi:MAG: transposase [Flavobacteriaceae bacterium]|nr:MAG: transposase [Flavobacteriaceae bacterium]
MCIDVHKDITIATIRSSNTEFETRKFGAYTSSLTDLRDWCKSEVATHVAMESTGVYWMLVFNVLEEYFEEMNPFMVHINNKNSIETQKINQNLKKRDNENAIANQFFKDV